METLFALRVIREGNLPVTSGPHPKGPVIFSMIREKAVHETVELCMIWDPAKAYVVNFFNLIVIQILPYISS